jgi:hypothetical protein
METVMQSRTSYERWNGWALAGALLVVVGIGLFVARELRFDPFAAVADAGWPFLVIIPGVILLTSSLIPKPPQGVGFAIGGSIVTTVGTVLLYQQTTGHWASWAYAWALVGPGAAGLGMAVYGLIFRQRELVLVGARLLAIAAAIFVAGFWFFETVFATGLAPVDLGTWWPIVIVALGIAALVAGFAGRERGTHDGPSRSNAQGGTR